MPATGWPSPNRIDVAWGCLAAACLGVMVAWPAWETVPFHVVWISLTLLYGFRVWSPASTATVLGLVAVLTGWAITADAFAGSQLWGELFEVPLMSAMFLAMVWHARRRVQAMERVETLARDQSVLLEHEERFLHDVSHELRTPVTIARGHLELLARRLHEDQPELAVAFDELQRIERIVDRLLLLARVGRDDSLAPTDIELVPFLEDVFMRWAEMAPRAWRLGSVPGVTLHGDRASVRNALDALIENAVHHTPDHARIELSARREGGEVIILVEDEGYGIPEESLTRIFERFARADASRSRTDGGAGLGLAIVDAIARAHGGSCSVSSAVGRGSRFALRFPARPELRTPPGLRFDVLPAVD